PAKSVRFLSAERSCTFRDRPGQWWLTVARRFQAGQEAEVMVRWLKKPVPISAFCPVHVSPRGSNHSRRLTDLRGVRLVPRKTILRARERCQPLSMFRQPAHFGAKWQTQADLCRWAGPRKGLRSGIACCCSPFAER